MDGKRLMMGLALLMSALACGPRNQFVHYDAGLNRVISSPAYARTGDSIFLVVRDTVLANRWTGSATNGDAVVGARTVLQGGLDIGKLAAGLPEAVLAVVNGGELTPKAAALIAASESRESTALTNARLFGGTRSGVVKALFRELPMAAQGAAGQNAEVRRVMKNEFGRIRAQRDSTALAACTFAREKIRDWIVATPSRGAYLATLLSSNFQEEVSASIADAKRYGILPDRLDRISRLMRRGWLTASDVDSLVVNSLRWSRVLAALSSMIGGEAAGDIGKSGELRQQLSLLHVCLNDDRRRVSPDVAALQVRLIDVWKSLSAGERLTADTTWGTIERESIFGLDLDPLIDEKHQHHSQISKGASHLATIGEISLRLERLLDVAPLYTARLDATTGDEAERAKRSCACERPGATDTSFIGVFWKPTQLTISPVKGVRYPKIAFGKIAGVQESSAAQAPPSTAPTPAKPNAAALAASGTGANAGATQGRQEQEPGKGASRESADPKAGGVPDVPPPNFEKAIVDVLQPARFQMSIGITRSELSTSTFTAIDTVEGGVAGTRVLRTGQNRRKTFAMLALSYHIVPTRGKVFASQADQAVLRSTNGWARVRSYLEQSGLAATLGLALDAPLERTFVGFSTEPFPGLTLSAGAHYAFVERSAVELPAGTAFVPDSQTRTPIVKRWSAPHLAWNVGLDPTIVVNAFGKALGIK